MTVEPTARARWREAVLVVLVFAPLGYLLFVHGGPIPQEPSFHALADTRSWLGVPNFWNIASNLPFLLVGAAGLRWCVGKTETGARLSWLVFFLGVALVCFGSGYYHRAPGNETLVWDRLPITVALMGLFAALVSEHVSERIELALLVPALAVGAASVILWSYTDDLRAYIWVQLAPLLAIPYVIAVYPSRHTHNHYLIYGLAFYALAKVAEFKDQEIYDLTATFISGHVLKHLLAAAGAYFVYLMLRRRVQVRKDEG